MQKITKSDTTSKGADMLPQVKQFREPTHIIMLHCVGVNSGEPVFVTDGHKGTSTLYLFSLPFLICKFLLKRYPAFIIPL